MKNYSIQFSLFLTIFILLGSCGISIDLQKRKHLSGYQVNIGENKLKKSKLLIALLFFKIFNFLDKYTFLNK